ncbi:MAG: tyrosine-type recombinase/integrase [Thermoplasmatota archaeon]
MAPTAPTTRPRFASNQDILQAWHNHAQQVLRPDSTKNYRVQINRFLQAWGNHLIHDLTPRDLWAYLDQYRALCSQYRLHNPSTKQPYCFAGQQLPCTKTCTKYEAMKHGTIEAHLNAIVHLYDFLARREYVSHNIARDVKRQWQKESRHQRRTKKRRLPTQQEIKALIHGNAPINHRALYAILAKTGLRIGEACHLRIQDVDLQNRRITIPEYGGKRRGNRDIPIDTQLAVILRQYNDWRQDHNSSYYLLHAHGGSLHAMDINKRNNWLKQDQAKAGIKPGITYHCFRHYYSNHLKHSGIDNYWWHILRGDKPPGTQDPYIHPTWQDIQRQYRQHAPRIA